MTLLKLGQSMQHQLMTSAFSPPSMSPSTISPADDIICFLLYNPHFTHIDAFIVEAETSVLWTGWHCHTQGDMQQACDCTDSSTQVNIVYAIYVLKVLVAGQPWAN